MYIINEKIQKFEARFPAISIFGQKNHSHNIRASETFFRLYSVSHTNENLEKSERLGASLAELADASA